MIKLCGVKLSQLPNSSALKERVDPRWYQAWKAHHGHMRNERARQLSLGGLLLLEYLGGAGELMYADTGRPYLMDGRLDFNISHTDRQVFCAIVCSDQAGGRVGLDAETRDHVSDQQAPLLARRWFSQREYARFEATPTVDEFLRIWTQKEALGKWLGQGLREMRSLDTECAESTYGVRFYEYTEQDTRIALCLNVGQLPPDGVQWLSRAETDAF